VLKAEMFIRCNRAHGGTICGGSSQEPAGQAPNSAHRIAHPTTRAAIMHIRQAQKTATFDKVTAP
jgi:hypothetical protein